MNPRRSEQIELNAVLKGRELYVWGAGHFGVAVAFALARAGVELSGFVDSNFAGREMLGFKVRDPEDVLALGEAKVCLIVASSLHAADMSRRCEEHGFRHGHDYLTHADIKPHHFEIDVAGACNLKCLTCPQGNLSKRPLYNMMSVADYRRVVDKLIDENPLLPDVQIYSWGEPLLNPELPAMIAHNASRRLATAVSSNLSLRCDLEAVVKASPTWFRVSLSGADAATYAIIHRGGRFDVVVDNLRLLARLRAAFAPRMLVEVNYHLYKHNLDGVPIMAGLCKELGFVFRTNYAFIDPLDDLIEYAKGRPLPPLMEEGRRHLLLDIDEAIGLSRESGSGECVSENCFVIASDLSFRRCNHLFDVPCNVLADSFLETSFDDILQRAEKCVICRECRALGTHRYHLSYV
ncbi:MAG: radical SAM protein, partial [Patescibacteria group bacterium]|nr:radical SAM protein [Patescibacteria group bacterium]